MVGKTTLICFTLFLFKKKKKYRYIFPAALSSDHLQGGEGMIHPKAIPYNQTRDHSTGGSHHSSDRGSNSTSGEANN